MGRAEIAATAQQSNRLEILKVTPAGPWPCVEKTLLGGFQVCYRKVDGWAAALPSGRAPMRIREESIR